VANTQRESQGDITRRGQRAFPSWVLGGRTYLFIMFLDVLELFCSTVFVSEPRDLMSLLSMNSGVTSYGDVIYTTCQSMRHVVGKSSCISVCSKAFLVGVNALFLVRRLYPHITLVYCSHLVKNANLSFTYVHLYSP